ncbi:ORF6N domain-containing protein [Candidatus Peregrinibacteria bacterium]|nr:ORF6N domain-containing protein [Candidatus Peregrinibacteria bacterium]
MQSPNIVIPDERIEAKIFFLRGKKVIMDNDLAALYGVETKNLIRAVKRNIERFPEDFMFILKKEEFENLRFHFGTSNVWGGRRYLPYVFTEQGIAMLSSVLKSERAIQVNIQIMRTFTKLREMLTTNKVLREKIEKLEQKYDGQFKTIFKLIKQLLSPEEKQKTQIGFKLEKQ